MSHRSTPLTLLPAMLCDGQLWSRQIMDLSPDTAIELADLTLDESIAAMAARVLARAPARFAAAGVGLGGHVALEIMRQAPDRIDRLALIGTRGTSDRRVRLAEQHGSLATAPLADPTLTPLISGQAQAMADRIGRDVFARQQRALLARPAIDDMLGSIAVPTLVAVGDRDRICTRSDALALHARIPGATFMTIADCGHLAPLERPGAVTQALRGWLRQGEKRTWRRAA
ncbi:alpha/beta fold hydrolase [Novosphingobium sp. Leaf2]|uniref:alpha/beta fold hydrolase n=1 Tax=Novosphingobium sp. Leaf2 TaxID=1735670 RepID=UPI0006F53FA3|nr:alpha/beta fold hydrolase [Novosphingobium sp. Leaf2]